MAIATINPFTGETEKTYDAMSDAEVDARLAKAAATSATFRRTSFAQRAAWTRAAADILDAEVDAIARMMTVEMGKPITAARGEARKCAVGLRFYADHAESFLADEPADAGAVGASRAWVRYDHSAPCWPRCRGTFRCGR